MRGAGRGFRGGFRGVQGGFRGFGGRGRGRGGGSFYGAPPDQFDAPTEFTPSYQSMESLNEFAPRSPRSPSIFPVTLRTLSPGEAEPKDRQFPSSLSLLEWVQSAPRGALKAFATHAEPETIYGKSDYHSLDVNRVYGIHYLEVNQEGEVAMPIVDLVALPREGTKEEVKMAEQDHYAEQNPGGAAAVS